MGRPRVANPTRFGRNRPRTFQVEESFGSKPFADVWPVCRGLLADLMATKLKQMRAEKAAAELAEACQTWSIPEYVEEGL